MKVRITFSDRSLEAELLDTELARRVAAELPIEAQGNRWGDEIYFSIDADVSKLEKPVDVVEKGDLAFWPPGNAFCVFWGPTPMSCSTEVRPASAVEVFGRILGDPSQLDGTPGGSVRVEVA